MYMCRYACFGYPKCFDMRGIDLKYFLGGEIFFWTPYLKECSNERMRATAATTTTKTATKPSGLYPWSRDLEGARDVNLREKPHFAMLLGWMEKFVCSNGLQPGRESCTRFWREGVMVRHREAWQIEQWSAVFVD